MNLALVITDLDNKIVYTNGQTEEITGYSEEELLGKTPPYPFCFQCCVCIVFLCHAKHT